MDSTLLLWVVTGLYAVQAGMSITSGHIPQGIMVTGYVVANLGLIWSYK